MKEAVYDLSQLIVWGLPSLKRVEVSSAGAQVTKIYCLSNKYFQQITLVIQANLKSISLPLSDRQS